MKTNKKTKKRVEPSVYRLSYGKKTVRFIIDKVFIFRLMRNLHGRFWGVAGLLIMLAGFTVCFLIDRQRWQLSTAVSDFGRDVRTAPYLAASLFFGAYGLWRWRSYLRRTLRHAKPVTSLVGLTVLGLYVAALMPVAWEPVPYRIHIFGVTLAGISMAATVVADTLLTRTRKNRFLKMWQFFRLCSFLLIMVGGFVTLWSTNLIGSLQWSLLGEATMLAGYTIWIMDKTFRGEGSQTKLSIALKRIVIID